MWKVWPKLHLVQRCLIGTGEVACYGFVRKEVGFFLAVLVAKWLKEIKKIFLTIKKD